MLPDFPGIKDKFRKQRLIPFVKMKESEYLGVLSQIPTKPIYEGNRTILIRADGTVDKMKPKKIVSRDIPINLKEVEDMTQADIFLQLDKASEEIARYKFQMIINKLSKSVEKVGNVINVKGRPFTINDFFTMINIIQLDFDENENPILPTVLGGDKASKSMSKVLTKLETDLNTKKRFAKIIEKKREEWRARESNRELVG